ncbi:MAG: tetratricopeptide repeat protein, partial [Elusimicrobia bacterium]|nr:tetratricopeptide repeat protein [Elusimicrobiota bacterium]
SRAASPAFKRGMSALDAKNYSRAIIDFRRTIRAEPRNSAAYFLMGYAYYQKGFAGGNPETADKKDARETVAAYKKVLALDPTLESVAKPYEFYFTQALSYECLGKKADALKSFEKGIEAAPDNFLIPLYAARLRFLMQDIEKAKANLALSLKRAQDAGHRADLVKLVRSSALFSSMADNAVLSPLLGQGGSGTQAGGDGALHDSLGNQAAAIALPPPSISPDERAVLARIAAGDQAFRSARYAAALTAYQDALAMDSRAEVLGRGRRALIEGQIGLCHRSLGLTAFAAADFKTAVSLMPFDAEAHYQLALADAVLGRTAQSLGQLKWSFETAPSQADLRRYLVLSKVEADFGAVRGLTGYSALASRYSGPSPDR